MSIYFNWCEGSFLVSLGVARSAVNGELCSGSVRRLLLRFSRFGKFGECGTLKAYLKVILLGQVLQ